MNVLCVHVTIQYLSVTVELWNRKRGFIGITLHYVDYKTLNLISHAVAYRCLKTSHTGDQSAKVLAKIFIAFGITSKITCSIMDNAINIVRAIWILDVSCKNEETDDEETTMLQMRMTNADTELLDLTALFKIGSGSDLDNDVSVLLRKHVRCATHSQNSEADVDSRNSRKNDKYNRMYDKAMANVQASSNAVNRSTNHADSVNKFVD